MLLFGFGLAAAGVLPRLSFNGRSNLAGGYGEQASSVARLGGITAKLVLHGVLSPGLYYPGGATLILAFAALLVAWRRYRAPYFVVLSLASLLLALKTTTPLHYVLYHLLPRFEALHRHWPERVAMVAYLGLALLAGATVAALGQQRRRSLPLTALVLLPTLVALALVVAGAKVSASALAGLVAAALLVAIAAGRPSPRSRRAVPILLTIAVCADLLITGRGILANGPYGGFHRVNLDRYYAPGGAATFLMRQSEDGPFRFFGYDPQLETTEKDGVQALYRYQFDDARASALIVNNRASLYGLQDVQGYNPVQSTRYVEFIRALNGRAQDYHESNIYGSGLTSPLLDLLNVCYIVVPANAPANRSDLDALSANLPTVYADQTAKVLVNPGALPRAWIVHAAAQVAPGGALAPLASGAVDPRRTALLETAPPPLATSPDPATDRAVVTSYAPNRIRLTATTDAAGLLMMSEIYDPDWHATVDGKPVRLYEADHILRAVPVPAGTHSVELTYAPGSLALGLSLTLATAGVMLLLLALAGWRSWTSRRSAPQGDRA